MDNLTLDQIAVLDELHRQTGYDIELDNCGFAELREADERKEMMKAIHCDNAPRRHANRR